MTGNIPGPVVEEAKWKRSQRRSATVANKNLLHNHWYKQSFVRQYTPKDVDADDNFDQAAYLFIRHKFMEIFWHESTTSDLVCPKKS